MMQINYKQIAMFAFALFMGIENTKPVAAQEFQRLQDITTQVAPSYIPTRCAALHQAIMEWGGETRLGSELWQQTDELRSNFIAIAGLIAQQTQGGTVEDVITSIVRDVRNVADIYLDRFENNYAMSGQAIVGDQIVSADLNYCQGLVQ